MADYVRHSAALSTVERASEKVKTGAFTGRYVINPVNGERIPVWVADYVLMEYGTGAIMAVPAHDERDFDFARAVRPRDPAGDPPARRRAARGRPVRLALRRDVLVNSGGSTACPAPEAQEAIIAWLDEEGRGEGTIAYRLRDWLLSRQRYWGCPIPIVYCDACGMVPVPDDQLPVVLPDIEDYAPRGRSPLAAAEDWVRTTCPTLWRGGAA